jgi:hypothetical protein
MQLAVETRLVEHAILRVSVPVLDCAHGHKKEKEEIGEAHKTCSQEDGLGEKAGEKASGEEEIRQDQGCA